MKDEDVTRSTVQKAVVVLASKPLFGPIRDRLGVVTRALFEQRYVAICMVYLLLMVWAETFGRQTFWLTSNRLLNYHCELNLLKVRFTWVSTFHIYIWA